MRKAVVAILMLLGALAMACAGEGYAAPKPDKAAFGPSGPQRNNCNEILGTPFRSVEERQWYEKSCSKWPATNFGDMAIAKATQQDSPACAALRGRLYSSDVERQWFLTNCPSIGIDQASPAAAPAAAAATTGTDRNDCNAIRGTPYRSATEQVWFYRYCAGQSAPVQAAPAPPPSQQQPVVIQQNNSGQANSCNPRSNGRGRGNC